MALSGQSPGSLLLWIQVGRLRVDRLQITLLAASELITCRFLIIPETRFLPFGKLPLCVGIVLLHPSPLAACLTFFFLSLPFNRDEKNKLSSSSQRTASPQLCIDALADSPWGLLCDAACAEHWEH